MAQLPDGRLVTTSQSGQLKVVQNGTATTALDLTATAKVCTTGEMGLLSVAVDPQFATNGYLYLFYTASVGSCALTGAGAGGAKNRVSRFTMTGSTVSVASEVILLDNMPEWGGNHNGGDVRVANDGTLFVTVGDGGAGRPDTNPSDLSLPNGKVLRINRDGTIPAGNPNGTTVCKTAWGPPGAAKVCGEIWADGLRNPFRLGFDASAPGAKFRINDVGDITWEEVDDAVAGAHYGWPCREGPAAHASSAPCNTPTTDPLLYYNHSTGCNVETAGAFVPRRHVARLRRRLPLGRLRLRPALRRAARPDRHAAGLARAPPEQDDRHGVPARQRHLCPLLHDAWPAVVSSARSSARHPHRRPRRCPTPSSRPSPRRGCSTPAAAPAWPRAAPPAPPSRSRSPAGRCRWGPRRSP